MPFQVRLLLMGKHNATLFLLLVICASAQNATAQTLSFSRPTAMTVACDESPFWHIKVYEDDDYLFVYRHYGRAEYTPGFFVYGKRQNKWLEIKKLSTEHAKLGRSPNIDEVRLSVSWNYSDLRNVEYADLPLRTSGSINFPDKIKYDAEVPAYCLEFNSSAKREEMLTQFWVLRVELEEALG